MMAARHRFMAIYIQLSGGLKGDSAWGREAISNAAKDWRSQRRGSHAEGGPPWPKLSVVARLGFEGMEHDVVVAEWSTEPERGG